MKNIYLILSVLLVLGPGQNPAMAQKKRTKSKVVYKMPEEGSYMRYLVEDGDTIYIASIPAAIKFSDRGKRDWRKDYRLLVNFSKTYPYALEAKRLLLEVDNTLEAENMGKRKRDKYINTIQQDLLDKYEPVLRKMTVTQGKLLIQLIGRETGLTPYDIINDYKNSMAAGLWQGIAKLFGGDLKKTYDPDGSDWRTEELVEIWQKGQFAQLYMSIIGVPPQIPVIRHDQEESGKTGRKKKKA